MAEGSGEGCPSKEGTEEDIHSRHKREMKDLRNKIQALKKSVSKGDKKRKKDVATEIAKLEAEIESRHETELKRHLLLDAPPDDSNQGGVGVASIASATDEIELGEEVEGEEGAETQKKSKSKKKRERKQRKEQERERRIAEGEVEETKSQRNQERQKLLSLLEPQGLAIKDINPDGNCLYAAISDQLELLHGKKLSVQRLREECGHYIEEHADLFMSFITDPDTGDSCSPEYFHSYCTEIKETAVWGGEAELVALSHIYKLPIVIHQSEAPTLCIGDEKETETVKPIRLSYHSHEFSLGKHYNSVIPKL